MYSNQLRLQNFQNITKDGWHGISIKCNSGKDTVFFWKDTVF